MRRLSILFSILLFISCNKQESERISLKFSDEYVLTDSLVVENTLVGGLSGIDYQNGTYYIVCDDAKKPRFYEAKIEIDNHKIDTVLFEKVVVVKDTTRYYDLESILREENKILLVSEGLISQGKDPAFFSINKDGDILDNFKLPEHFKANSPQKPRTNGVFEGLAESFDKRGYWVIAELPLEADGIAPTHKKAESPGRMTYFNKETQQAEKQVVYPLDKIAKKPLGDFAVNGVTDLLGYAPNKFLVIERSFSSGHGTNGNTIKIYTIDISSATNTLELSSLKETSYKPVIKQLLFNFDSVREKLTHKMIDNVEGVCFGPELSNGNQSLIFVVDNDFDLQGNRLNQLLLMEAIMNN